ncbi:hydantoinase/oxoprolinase family protein [Rubrobacter calidifluminis]|uniref:hydantoinase/oxoprolinase family protein n=1 Tax=Rubrobacter calidifluminis TaxID=1392640 RepID=UPI00235DD6A0|nr:hydantoinase/oxoprolinase family protein [Rubrobacter calidifluminis]
MRLAVDIGGTFTDVCLFDEEKKSIRVGKVSSTKDTIDAVFEGIKEVGVSLAELEFFSHGTTVATNALIQRNFPRAAMITTKGFRDVIEIRRGTKQDLWDAYKDVSPPYIRRRDRFEISERVDFAGRELEPVNEGEVRKVARLIQKRGIKTVAVCLVNSYANPSHEQQVRRILEAELSDVSISTSSEVLPEIFEHERFSTTIANAVLSPLVGSYAKRLADRMRDGGYRGDVLLLHSGGGVMTADVVERFAGRLASSGLAAGAIACGHLAKLAGYENAVGLDMGGTSADISVMVGGETRITNDWFVEYGYPIRFPSVEVSTIGAGGGSIAWIDAAGSLRNGPQSAGSNPGPACYGRGGEEPTNTDANLLLGRLGEELIGGAMRLDREKAQAAVAKIGDPLGLDTTEAARAIIRVANANLADAIRLALIQRGHDPRDFALVAFGGAGPLHGAELARELSIPTVLVPPNPGITSALGCLIVDIRHDFSEMHLVPTGETDPREIEARFAALEDEARERLRAEGIEETEMRLLRSVDMRYLGQWRSLEIAVDGKVESLERLTEMFHEEHERQHTYKREDSPVEIYQLKVAAIGRIPKPELPYAEPREHEPEPNRHRKVVFGDGESVETAIYSRDSLSPGARIAGPAIVGQLDSTVVIPPGDTAEVDGYSNIIVRVGGAK